MWIQIVVTSKHTYTHTRMHACMRICTKQRKHTFIHTIVQNTTSKTTELFIIIKYTTLYKEHKRAEHRRDRFFSLLRLILDILLFSSPSSFWSSSSSSSSSSSTTCIQHKLVQCFFLFFSYSFFIHSVSQFYWTYIRCLLLLLLPSSFLVVSTVASSFCSFHEFPSNV